MSKEKEVEEVEQKPQYTVDLDKLMPQKHNWIDRGLVMSCENGGHPTHRAFKRR